jgi:hypothetical protein
MDRSRIISKVAKLLSMAKHSASNEQEAATALRQAEAMMRKHDVRMAELNTHAAQAEGDMIKADTDESRNSRWVWNLAWAASYLTDVMPTKRRGVVQFCGTAHDTEVAGMYFDYLVSVTERLAKKYNGNRAQRNAFKMGCAMAISGKTKVIKREREEDLRKASSGTDLVVVKKDLICKKFGLSYAKARAYTISDGGAYHAGKRAGSGVSLNTQVSGTKRAGIRAA